MKDYVSKYDVARMASVASEQYEKLYWWQFKAKKQMIEIIIWCYKTLTRP